MTDPGWLAGERAGDTTQRIMRQRVPPATCLILSSCCFILPPREKTQRLRAAGKPAYNGCAALAALIIPIRVRRWGLRVSHIINVWLGAAGLLAFLVIRDPQWLLVAMIGVGFAWASILSLPYALLSENLPAEKMGVYMGIFNFLIVIPQLLAPACWASC